MNRIAKRRIPTLTSEQSRIIALAGEEAERGAPAVAKAK